MFQIPIVLSVLATAVLTCQNAQPPAAPASQPSRYVCPPCGCESDGKVFESAGTCPSCGMALRAQGAQQVSPQTGMVEADRHFDAREWDKAGAAYRRIVQDDPRNARAWHRLGYCLHVGGKLDEALEAHRRAAEFPETRALGHYNMACVHARRNRKDDALRELEAAVDAGFRNGGLVRHDSDLESLRGEPRFVAVLKRLVEAETRAAAARTRVAIVVHDDVELLDFAGPAEVFGNTSVGGQPAFRVFTVAPAAGNVRAQESVTVVPEYTIANCPPPDILVIPGGDTDRLLEDSAFMEWLRRTVPSTQVTMTVCTGAFTLAELGLLDGLAATTHVNAIRGFRAAHPRIEVRENVRFVDNGRIVTTAGVSAGIDGALHVVARLCGEDVARQTARSLEYEWRPGS